MHRRGRAEGDPCGAIKPSQGEIGGGCYRRGPPSPIVCCFFTVRRRGGFQTRHLARQRLHDVESRSTVDKVVTGYRCNGGRYILSGHRTVTHYNHLVDADGIGLQRHVDGVCHTDSLVLRLHSNKTELKFRSIGRNSQFVSAVATCDCSGRCSGGGNHYSGDRFAAFIGHRSGQGSLRCLQVGFGIRRTCSD